MQIETGDITPMISTPIDSRMLDSIFVEHFVGLGFSLSLSHFSMCDWGISLWEQRREGEEETNNFFF